MSPFLTFLSLIVYHLFPRSGQTMLYYETVIIKEKSSMEELSMKALVVYTTITGNNEDVADIITDALEDLDVDVDETEITMANPAD